MADSPSASQLGSPSIVKVATLTRRSTDEEHQPYSIEARDERLGAYIRSQEGWELYRKYSDNMSGSTLDCPGLQRALSDARLHRYGVLLVYRVDRLARSVRGLAQVLEDLDRAGCVFRSATEPFETGTPDGLMVVQMVGLFAEFERATIIDASLPAWSAKLPGADGMAAACLGAIALTGRPASWRSTRTRHLSCR